MKQNNKLWERHHWRKPGDEILTDMNGFAGIFSGGISNFTVYEIIEDFQVVASDFLKMIEREGISVEDGMMELNKESKFLQRLDRVKKEYDSVEEACEALADKFLTERQIPATDTNRYVAKTLFMIVESRDKDLFNAVKKLKEWGSENNTETNPEDDVTEIFTALKESGMSKEDMDAEVEKQFD